MGNTQSVPLFDDDIPLQEEKSTQTEKKQHLYDVFLSDEEHVVTDNEYTSEEEESNSILQKNIELCSRLFVCSNQECVSDYTLPEKLNLTRKKAFSKKKYVDIPCIVCGKKEKVCIFY